MSFPLFPDLLKELMSSWKDRPYSGRSAILGVSSLNCDADVNVGTKCGHPSAPLAVSPIFGTVLATMQHRYKVNKKENEALQLCFLQMSVLPPRP